MVDFDYYCVVEDFERVTVRAGAFDAFKVVCDDELSRDVSWASQTLGLNIKTDFLRKPGYPNGEGTQRAELAALNLAK